MFFKHFSCGSSKLILQSKHWFEILQSRDSKHGIGPFLKEKKIKRCGIWLMAMFLRNKLQVWKTKRIKMKD